MPILICNINEPILTPQKHNQITNLFGIGQNLQNNVNNLNQLGKSPINSIMAQPTDIIANIAKSKNINPNLIMRLTYPRNDNEQEMNKKDEKSSKNLSEETLSRGGNLQNESANLQINKNNYEFINQEILMINRFLRQQPNYLPKYYNMII